MESRGPGCRGPVGMRSGSRPRPLASPLALGRWDPAIASLVLFALLPSLQGCDGGEAPPPGNGLEALEAPTFAQARETGEATLRVIYVPSSGFAGRDEDGRLTGVTVELLRRFGHWVEEAHGIDVDVEFVEEPLWATFYQRVRHSRGGVFGIGNVTITEPRRDELAFSPPYLSNVATLMTHADVPELGSMERVGQAFAGMRGLRYPGTLHEQRLNELRRDWFPELQTVPVESNDELVEMTASGEGYFGYIDIYNYWRAVERGMPLRRHPVADDASEEFGVIMPRGSDWAAVMEAFFQAHDGVQESPWYRALLTKHLGEELATLLLPRG
jgi:ABC-type amino acid transport substrate-binding protein